MQREPNKKNFTLSHERFVLDVDPYRRFIEGSAELTIQPLEQLSNIRINSRHCYITKTYVNGIPVDWNSSDPVSDLTLGGNTNVAHHQIYKSKYLAALRDADDGELYISIPQHCVKQMTESEAQLISNQIFLQSHTDMNEDGSEKPVNSNETNTPSYAPIVIRIDFKLEDPRAGIVFVEPDDDIAPYRAHHLYTVNQPLPGATRAWLPCIDRIAERCTWDMEFVVPRRMGGNAMDIDSDSTYEEDATVVVCSGEVVEQVIHPKDPSKKIVHYNLSVPTAAPFIGFAIGPFEMIKLSPSQLQEEVLNAAELDESQQQSLMAEINMMSNIYAFALPGFREELNISCTFLMHAMHFYAQEYGSYPFSDFKLVFIDDAWSDTASSASLAICSSRLLHDSNIIDQTYHTRHALSLALARQWFGVHIIQKTWMDTWLIVGLANLMGSLFIKRHLGNNEYRLRLKKDMELCCSLDVNRAPLYNPALPSPLDPDDLSFLELKAPLVLYILDRRMCKAGSTLGLSRVIPKILVSAMSGELAQNAISTHYFMRLCRKVSGFDTKTFADQWVYKSGCPKFNFAFNFNRKKMVVEFFMKQENTNTFISSTQDGEHAPLTDGGIVNYQEFMTPLFTGSLTVRIHEADGTPYEHILDIHSAEQKYEVQFNTKYKRIRRNTKRFRAKQAAAAAAVAEEEQENEEGVEPGTTTMLGIIPSLGLGMPVFEDPVKKQEWQIYEWGQGGEDTSGAASAMFDWIRLDAEFEWLTSIEFQQPDYMWAAQLTKDRDVVAQHDAVGALQLMPSPQTSTSLLRALLDQKCFYKIRMECAYALASCASPAVNWIGLLQLGKMFRKRYCFPISSPDDENDDIPLALAIPKPNNFSNIPDYFIQKAVVIAFSQIRDNRGLAPEKVRKLLLDLLKYNDNIGNEFSDCYYIATMISALGDSLIPSSNAPEVLATDSTEGKELITAALSEIERFRTLDYVIPTYHNIVTVACLKTITKLMMNNLMDVNLATFMPYTRYGNYLEVRLTAFDSLFVLTGLLNNELTSYFLTVIKDDPCAYVSHYVSRAMLSWLGLALKDKSDTTKSKAVEEFAEEEGKVVIEDEKRRLQKTVQQEFQASVEALRKRFGDNVELQQNLWDLLNSPENITIDHSIRKYLLQFCEYMYKPIDVGLKVTIRVPALQPQETPEDISEPPTPIQPILRISKPKQPSKEKKDLEGKSVKPTSSIRSFVSDNNEGTREPATPPDIESPTAEVTNNLAETKLTTTVKTPKAPKPTASKTVAKKSSKMPSGESKKVRRIYNKLQKHRAAAVFLQEVNEVLDGAPGYYEIIKNPMDLGKIKNKVDEKVYSSFSEFEADVRLMLNNCYVFNLPGSFAYDQGQILENVLEKELAKGREGDESQNMTIVESREPSPIGNTTMVIPTKSSETTPSESPTSIHPSQQQQPLPRPSRPQSIQLTQPSQSAESAQSAQSIQPTQSSQPTQPTQPAQPTQPIQPPQAQLPRPRPQSQPPQAQKSQTVLPVSSPKHQQQKSEPPPTTTGYTQPQPISHQPPTVNPISAAPPLVPSSVPRRRPDKEICVAILNKTMESRHAFEFIRPVDPIKQGIPQYAHIIKKPMDLGTIKSKLKADQYLSVQQFDDDVRLMLSNCYKFNPPNTYVYNEAKQLEQVYNKEYGTYFDTNRLPSTPTPPKSGTPTVSSIPQTKAPIANPPIVSRPTVQHPLPTTATAQQKSNTSANASVTTIKKEKSRKTSLKTVPPMPTAAAPAGSPVNRSSPSRQSAIQPQMDDRNTEKCRRILVQLWNQPESIAFHYPLDVVMLNIPTYLDIIKRPMDLTTVGENLDKGNIKTIWDFERDIRQIFWNCFRFNDSMSAISQQGQTLLSFFNKLWYNEYAEPNCLKGDDERIANNLMSVLMKHEYAALFTEPVDTYALPEYKERITSPMDLRTMTEKLATGRYSSLQQVDSDLRLMFSNCFKFNNSKSFAYDQGKRLERYYQHSGGKEIRARLKEQQQQRQTTPTASNTSHKPSPTPPSKSISPSTPRHNPAPAARPPVATPTAPPISNAPRTTTISTSAPAPPSTTPVSISTSSPSSSQNTRSVTVPPLKTHSTTPPARPASTSAVTSTVESTSSLSKGAQTSAPTASPSTSTVTKLLPGLYTKLDGLLSKLKKNKSAFAFLVPVDPIALQIPHYSTIVPNPMDLGTMTKKLKSGAYKTTKDFEVDFRLIVTNCILFNGPDHVVSGFAKDLETIFNKDIQPIKTKEEQLMAGIKSSGSSKSSGKKSSSSSSPIKPDVKKYKPVLDKLKTKEYYLAFAIPVDPVALQIPTYYDYVKHPMDFGTILKKLDKYPNADAFLHDVKQVFVNCYLFNLVDDIVAQWGRLLEQDFVNLCKEKGLKTIHIDMTKEREVAESEGALLQDLTFYDPAAFGNMNSAVALPTATTTMTEPILTTTATSLPNGNKRPHDDNYHDYQNGVDLKKPKIEPSSSSGMFM
ncbi:hypothetical protein BCR42DRAFT_415941 [Absidia repens]|uniref:Transcription initiation factor TFIID subunit 2 n=1 Tax=Absidia repens TaxID=90262 RepID=A0A1X2IFX0_9FUNG|nr:hypothetical protein BCR42DRAFT_415941 [Absidia repens]